jgi:hypothetical protein
MKNGCLHRKDMLRDLSRYQDRPSQGYDEPALE